jgi:hypothetical protein
MCTREEGIKEENKMRGEGKNSGFEFENSPRHLSASK